MTLRSFGCSFIYGTDLSSPSGTWPCLIASNLGLPYQCHAWPGIGNLQIMESILRNAKPGDLCIINWTWIDRFDFVDCTQEAWHTLRPALDHDHAAYYYRNLHSQYQDMLTNLIYIKTAVDFLKVKDCRFLMTAMDSLLFESVQAEWHDPEAVNYLQQQVKPHIKDFDGLDFLNWSRGRGFAVSESWHPLEQAHDAAADYFIDAIRHII